MTATVFVRGVEIPAESFEQTFHGLMNQVETNIRKEYGANDIDQMIEEKARKKALEMINEMYYNVMNGPMHVF